ncbi:aminoglycoside phosphotransferase family protein [Heyndrickxia camelliae]|uniref:Aminoglycoside phosphotransferase family protein n=2 Tax=Heyndrickxia camelliae TaxID=1707093 RepID=A0A2N3LKZ3_9BACI|nr:aminoglycoside phosphotransferase family protein [Heyndrickxia camelliae]
MMMIVKTVKNGKEGDENKRLLLYLSDVTGENFVSITSIKEGVWLCKTTDSKWILKEFFSPKSLNMQIKLTELLFSHHFSQTYRFHPVHAKKDISFNKRTYGLIQYIERNLDGKKFSYHSHENRMKALQLLKKFHHVTEQFSGKFENDMHVFNQIKKWQNRLHEFKANEKYLERWLPKKFYFAFLDWSEWSLDYMIRNKDYFFRKPYCIIHGDVAHHNFILGKDDLYLIDFDLAKVAPHFIDDLQFCNRILPHLNWSLKNLTLYKPLERNIEENPFLAALIYPTDLLREWNYFLKYEQGRGRLSSFLKEITFREFNEREKFVKEVISQFKHF